MGARPIADAVTTAWLAARSPSGSDSEEKTSPPNPLANAPPGPGPAYAAMLAVEPFGLVKTAARRGGTARDVRT